MQNHEEVLDHELCFVDCERIVNMPEKRYHRNNEQDGRGFYDFSNTLG